jgi:hypothetical protein
MALFMKDKAFLMKPALFFMKDKAFLVKNVIRGLFF